MIMHFNSQKERLAYLKGEFKEVEPIEAKPEKKEQPKGEKPSKKASKKRAKKDKDDDAVQAE